MKRILTQWASLLLVLVLIALTVFPKTLYAVGYGDCAYGEGNYNEGENCNATPTPTSGSSNSSSNSNSSNPSAPVCNDQPPGPKAPWLYAAVPQNGTSILLYFTEADDPHDYYTLEYGTKSGEYHWGATNIGGKGTRTYLIQSLVPNTTYHFRVRGGNGCATGPWSNEISTKTKWPISFKQLNFTESVMELTAQPSNLSESQSEKADSPNTDRCHTYTVATGDTLWTIAASKLGSGSSFPEIIAQNKETYPSLSTSRNLKVGWKLQLDCRGNSTGVDEENENIPDSNQALPEGYTLNVKVISKDSLPIKDAKVTLHSTVQEAITNEQGSVIFKNVEPGQHQVLVTFNGFEGEQSINVSGNEKVLSLTITVEQKNVLSSPIVIGIISFMGLIILILLVLLMKKRRQAKNEHG